MLFPATLVSKYGYQSILQPFIEDLEKLETGGIKVVVDGLVFRRWISNPGVPCSKPLGGSKVDSAFHPSEVNKMSTRNFWGLNDKK